VIHIRFSMLTLSEYPSASTTEHGLCLVPPHPFWHAACTECGDESESWYCVRCARVFCSRYVRGHMKEHYEETAAWENEKREGQEPPHCVAVSLYDLSVWCFACNQCMLHSRILLIFNLICLCVFLLTHSLCLRVDIKHQIFQQLLVRLEIQKFGHSSLGTYPAPSLPTDS
jgi:hypothetical protein